jgi:hypothetical protein
VSKVALKCISPHAPNEIVEVEETQVEGLIATGGYILVADNADVVTDFDAPKLKKRK